MSAVFDAILELCEYRLPPETTGTQAQACYAAHNLRKALRGKPTTVIMRGIPGSGKSTVARWIAEAVPCSQVVSADDYFMVRGAYCFDRTKLPQAHQECFLKAMHSVLCKTPMVVVDNTNTSAWEIAPYIMLAESHGMEVLILNVECPVDVARKRQTHGVPELTVKLMASRLAAEVLPPRWNTATMSGEPS